MKFGDIIVALLVVTIILLIIIPVPLAMLDFFLSINIALALLILLLAMFNTEALEFSVFPSMLLITTLFRLALNISTTRYILSKGQAGQIINAFGNFVVGGNAIVGFIIFIIIVLIQFLVITKGSERVSEVAARFTLDAMPGKQMAIDADLNSGLISESDAKERRVKIQREADFYGSMDGASKFVKGDAIAGIIITIINILAGFAIGILVNKLAFTEAISKYTLLTVGDGLVSQIPALMISTATGIVVTRAASDNNLGDDVISQLFRQSKVMFILGGVLFMLGTFTPLPIVPFDMLAVVFVYLGFAFSGESTKEEQEEEEVQDESEDLRKPENIIPLLQVDPIELEFGYGIIPLVDPNQGGDLFDRLVMIRRQIALEFGIVVPMIRLRDNIQLESNEYIIKIKGNELASGTIMFDHFMAMNPGSVDGEVDGIDTVEPAFGLQAKWITSEEREKAEIFGYTVVDPSSIISTHLTEIVKKYSYELIGRKEVKNLIDNVKENNSVLVDELIPGLMSIGDIQKVLANLLREGISIRDFVTILETLADYATTTKDVNILTEYVRQSLSRLLSNMYMPSKRAKVVTIEQELENRFMESIEQSDTGSYLSIDPVTSQTFLNNLAIEIQKIMSLGEQPIIITAPIVRFYIKKLTEQYIPDLIVLSYNEIESDVDIQSVGMVGV
ncbi:flagellar biosynthesis protein FlhA [Helicovermis profundi]|uniref:Flagellar biosynthesis protein FlhA n=1 Tax=Helicovermis profundi TaxID=3065157 RepID=A0AAU9EW84_9FIRM|nr:flagellar biosynthesis protein FlhA [Clostridia bacterium S502]